MAVGADGGAMLMAAAVAASSQQQQQPIQSPQQSRSQVQGQQTPQQQPQQQVNSTLPKVPSQDDQQQEQQSHQFILPSTMVPPSVLASMFPERSRNTNTGGRGRQPQPQDSDGGGSSSNKSDGGNQHEAHDSMSNSYKRTFQGLTRIGQTGMMKKAKKSSSGGGVDDITPQAFVEQVIAKKYPGRTFDRIKADDVEYDAVPSALQLASFGTHLVRAVHTSDTDLLSSLLECGLSSNPCNQFRDSVVDLVCKRANEDIFLCLLDHGCDIQTVDGFGRTPLHHSCWASTFCRPIVQAILDRDPIQLCMEDKHGQTPLEYVRSDLHQEWVDYLNEETFWKDGIPIWKPPNDSRPDGTLSDPKDAISVNLAALVSSGSITPEQVRQMDDVTRRTYNTSGGGKN